VTPDTNTSPAGNGAPLREIIAREFSAVLENRRQLLSQKEPNTLHFFVLFCCVLANVIFWLARSDYIAIFVAASLYLNMYYFITLLIPTTTQAASLPTGEITRFLSWLKENGVKSGTSQFSKLFINTFFINSRTLSLGIGLVFSVDIGFILIDYFRGLPITTTLIVLFQCVVFVVFYLLIWKLEPFSTKFVHDVDQVKSKLAKEKLPPKVIASVFMAGFLIAVFLFLTTIILLPGITVDKFVTGSGLDELGHLVSLLAILGVSQYFIIRYIHGITSRMMAERLIDDKEHALSDLLSVQDGQFLPGSPIDDNPFETGRVLLESRIYKINRNSLFGAFPVYVVDLDFSVILDSSTLRVIRGYIQEQKPQDQNE
jgi:hypothetical protein